MKSAYELAMDRLGKGAPARKLTTEQKAKLAEIENKYTAKIAEEEITLQPKIAAAQTRGDQEGAQKIEEQLRTQVDKLRRKLEEEKEAVRQPGEG
ncbi:hypothetical protein HQ590_00405 [bacterium]|nr:hypothetical protein [bacterium]